MKPDELRVGMVVLDGHRWAQVKSVKHHDGYYLLELARPDGEVYISPSTANRDWPLWKDGT
jgi:hypothetical protein